MGPHSDTSIQQECNIRSILILPKHCIALKGGIKQRLDCPRQGHQKQGAPPPPPWLTHPFVLALGSSKLQCNSSDWPWQIVWPLCAIVGTSSVQHRLLEVAAWPWAASLMKICAFLARNDISVTKKTVIPFKHTRVSLRI